MYEVDNKGESTSDKTCDTLNKLMVRCVLCQAEGSELGLNPQCDPASHPDQGEAVGAWLGVWHLWVDAHPQQALRLGCLPPVWAS